MKDYLTLRDGAFFGNLVHIPGKTNWIFMKILSQMYLWTRKSPLNFGGHTYTDSDPEQIRLGGGLCFASAFFVF